MRKNGLLSGLAIAPLSASPNIAQKQDNCAAKANGTTIERDENPLGEIIATPNLSVDWQVSDDMPAYATHRKDFEAELTLQPRSGLSWINIAAYTDAKLVRATSPNIPGANSNDY